VRFWRLRPSYIHCTREHLKETCDLRLRDLLESFDDPIARRDFLAKNKAIKGLGYKESSHFLRNIGFRGYAILDKHIVNSLREMGVIGQTAQADQPERVPGHREETCPFRRRYWHRHGPPGPPVWSRKTGEILK